MAQRSGTGARIPTAALDSEAMAYLSRPGLRRLLFAARERCERNGGPFGRVQLAALPSRRLSDPGS